MNYLQARKTKNDVWHFTNRNDDVIYPVGCTIECSHETAEQACDHYRDYLSEQLHKDHYPKQPHECEVEGCSRTSTYALRPVGEHRGVVLFRTHRNKEGWKSTQAYGTSIQIMSS